MPLSFYIGLAVLLIIIVLSRIVAVLRDIRETLDIIHRDLCRIHDDLVLLFGKKNKPGKQREYWRDQNGFKHWRKTNNA